MKESATFASKGVFKLSQQQNMLPYEFKILQWLGTLEMQQWEEREEIIYAQGIRQVNINFCMNNYKEQQLLCKRW